MKRMAVALLATAMLSLAFAATDAAGGAASAISFSAAVAQVASGRLGYLVPNAAAYVRAKALAAARAGQGIGQHQLGPHGTIDVAWDGVFDNSLSPPDPTGAIGPNSYVELINAMYGIYTRTGTLISSGTLAQLTGASDARVDPQILWDNNDQRFYYTVENFANGDMAWGFSKDNNPRSAADFCRYQGDFGYSGSTGTNFPDYPKLGNSPHLLLIGLNIFQGFGGRFLGGDVAWIAKGSVGPNPISTCPPQSRFLLGKFSNVKNADGSMINAPEPAVNTEPGLPTRPEGWMVGAPDVSSGAPKNYLTVYGFSPTPAGPRLSGPFTVPVASFNAPPNAPQCSSTKVLDTLDGRLEHAVAAADPLRGTTDAIWTAHAVAGGAGSQERWYEIDPTTNPPTLLQSGAATDSSLYVWNGGISPDRVVNRSGKAFGASMSMGFNTSNSATCPAAQDVSKVDDNLQSGFVLVKQSAGPDGDFTCSPVCRWGDYSGATPDPAADLSGTEGDVWHSNMWIASLNTRTENYEISP